MSTGSLIWSDCFTNSKGYGHSPKLQQKFSSAYRRCVGISHGLPDLFRIGVVLGSATVFPTVDLHKFAVCIYVDRRSPPEEQFWERRAFISLLQFLDDPPVAGVWFPFG